MLLFQGADKYTGVLLPIAGQCAGCKEIRMVKTDNRDGSYIMRFKVIITGSYLVQVSDQLEQLALLE